VAVVAGVDFGTLSVRVSIVDDRKGRLGSGVAEYPLYRTKQDPNHATQRHDDHMAALAAAMRRAVEDAGVDVMWDCRKGECGICQVKVLDVSGRIDHRDVFLSQQQKETYASLCLCVARAARGEPGDPGSASGEPAAVTLHLP